ncbi:MAG: manganese-binding transcriptional regulator MntR [Planctomycetota bacterium]
MPPADRSQHHTKGHHRTRRDHAQETAEDYVEAVAELIDRDGEARVTALAERFGVSHVTVTRTVDRLVEEGLLETEPRRPIYLTRKGTRLAEQSRERHEIVYAFLIALGVQPKIAALDAEGIEHHVSPETLALFRAFLEDQAQ